MQTGRILMEGPAQELLKNPEVEAAYLGTVKKEITSILYNR